MGTRRIVGQKAGELCLLFARRSTSIVGVVLVEESPVVQQGFRFKAS